MDSATIHKISHIHRNGNTCLIFLAKFIFQLLLSATRKLSEHQCEVCSTLLKSLQHFHIQMFRKKKIKKKERKTTKGSHVST
jgi:hypothetical protein